MTSATDGCNADNAGDRDSAATEGEHNAVTASMNSQIAGSPRVSVIVPTVGRPELIRALRSVRAQTTRESVEVIVVFDGKIEDEIDAEVPELADRVIRTAGYTGGSNARNLGISAAGGEYVAFLDDDDEWLPRKLELQLELASSMSDAHLTLVAGRHIHVDARTAKTSRPAPGRLARVHESVDHYLFRRRPPTGSRPSLYTSTLFCARSLAVTEEWNTSLRRHQDWDWTIRITRRAGVRLVQAPEPLVRIQTGSDRSISATSDWLSSLTWADAVLRRDPPVYADFLAAQTLRYALQARSLRGAKQVVNAIISSRRLPAPGPIVIGLAGLLKRRAIEKWTIATLRERRK